MDVLVDGHAIVTRHLATLARTGAGKSWTARWIIEELAAKHYPIVIFAPQATTRGFPTSHISMSRATSPASRCSQKTTRRSARTEKLQSSSEQESSEQFENLEQCRLWQVFSIGGTPVLPVD